MMRIGGRQGAATLALGGRHTCTNKLVVWSDRHMSGDVHAQTSFLSCLHRQMSRNIHAQPASIRKICLCTCVRQAHAQITNNQVAGESSRRHSQVPSKISQVVCGRLRLVPVRLVEAEHLFGHLFAHLSGLLFCLCRPAAL